MLIRTLGKQKQQSAHTYFKKGTPSNFLKHLTNTFANIGIPLIVVTQHFRAWAILQIEQNGAVAFLFRENFLPVQNALNIISQKQIFYDQVFFILFL